MKALRFSTLSRSLANSLKKHTKPRYLLFDSTGIYGQGYNNSSWKLLSEKIFVVFVAIVISGSPINLYVKVINVYAHESTGFVLTVSSVAAMLPLCEKASYNVSSSLQSILLNQKKYKTSRMCSCSPFHRMPLKDKSNQNSARLKDY